jgi:hypothetical protein
MGYVDAVLITRSARYLRVRIGHDEAERARQRGNDAIDWGADNRAKDGNAIDCDANGRSTISRVAIDNGGSHRRSSHDGCGEPLDNRAAHDRSGTQHDEYGAARNRRYNSTCDNSRTSDDRTRRHHAANDRGRSLDDGASRDGSAHDRSRQPRYRDRPPLDGSGSLDRDHTPDDRGDDGPPDHRWPLDDGTGGHRSPHDGRDGSTDDRGDDGSPNDRGDDGSPDDHRWPLDDRAGGHRSPHDRRHHSARGRYRDCPPHDHRSPDDGWDDSACDRHAIRWYTLDCWPIHQHACDRRSPEHCRYDPTHHDAPPGCRAFQRERRRRERWRDGQRQRRSDTGFVLATDVRFSRACRHRRGRHGFSGRPLRIRPTFPLCAGSAEIQRCLSPSPASSLSRVQSSTTQTSPGLWS